jgi:hypothetical protein
MDTRQLSENECFEMYLNLGKANNATTIKSVKEASYLLKGKKNINLSL